MYNLFCFVALSCICRGANNTNTTAALNGSNTTTYIIADDLSLPEYGYMQTSLQYTVTNEQRYKLEHYDDPNNFVEVVEEHGNQQLSLREQQEQTTLKEFYHSANGVYWIKNWDFSTATLCGQHGVQCTKQGFVTHLNLRGNNLSGVVPDNFLVQELVELDLSMNFLSGTIDFVQHFSIIQVIKLCDNRFTGPIPINIFRSLTGLKTFEAENNYLSGNIPSSFGHRRGLEIFRVSNNKLNGALPEYMGRPTSLRVFGASHNAISGGFPESFSNLYDDLEVLLLSHNQLDATLNETGLEHFHHLKILALDHNKLHGSLPADLTSLRRLEVLWLQSNHFKGKIPNLKKRNETKLQELRFGGNFLNCAYYDDLALVHTDSPSDIAVDCVNKIYHDRMTGLETTIYAIP